MPELDLAHMAARTSVGIQAVFEFIRGFSVSVWCLQVGCFLLWTGCVGVSACFCARVGRGGAGDNVHANALASVFLVLLRAGVVLRKRRKLVFVVFTKNPASSRFKAVFLKQIALTVMAMVRMMILLC